MPTVAFDMLGTFFSLQKPRRELVRLGAPEEALDLWFAQTLRDFFALSHAGGYAPVGEMLRETLPRTLDCFGVEPTATAIDEVMGTFEALDTNDGARRACELFDEQGWSIVAITNGSFRTTRNLLRRNDVLDYFAKVLSCDDILVSKPNERVYGWLTDQVGERPWLVAAHGWDVMGAARAGLSTAWVSQLEGEYIYESPRPDVTADGLVGAAEGILQF